jgi:hypothetical protein
MRLVRWIDARWPGLLANLIVVALAAFLLGVGLTQLAGLARGQEAGAEWPRKAYRYEAYKADLYWGQYHCGGRYRPEGCARWRWRRWQARERARWVDDGRERGGHQCLTRSPPVRGVSGQHNTEAASKRDAVFRWMLDAQAEHGSVYMNWHLATGKVWQCFQSQAHDTIGGKIVSGVGKLMGGEGYQVVCRVWATPCRAPFEREPDGKRKDRP